MAQGRFKLHDPEHTHILTIRVSDELYELIRDEVEYDRSTIQKITTDILRDGVEIRQIARLNKLQLEQERRQKIRQAAALVGTGD